MPPDYTDAWARLTAEAPVPIMMGENLYTRRGFLPFLANQGCHMIHPDFLRAGGLLESKKIADLAEIYNVPTGAHNMASPLGLVASAHAATAIRDFIAHECNFANLAHDLETWESFVHTEQPIIQDGRIHVSDQPGLGIELNEDVVRAHLDSQDEWWGS
jgi:L-alanine-DL-glutamate epimerase-like enolase superfamily enzyme